MTDDMFDKALRIRNQLSSLEWEQERWENSWSAGAVLSALNVPQSPEALEVAEGFIRSVQQMLAARVGAMRAEFEAL